MSINRERKPDPNCGFRIKLALLLLQILLPLALYFTFQSDLRLMSGTMAALFLLSMGLLVWMK